MWTDVPTARAAAPPVEPGAEGAYSLALIQIEHDGEVIKRLTQALHVATHAPHDQDGEPDNGFPVCSICGAIQTGVAGQPDCGAPSQGGPCVLPRGHNIGRADIPENHIGHSVRAAAPSVEPDFDTASAAINPCTRPGCHCRYAPVPPPDRVAGTTCPKCGYPLRFSDKDSPENHRCPDRVAGLREAAGRVLSWLGTCDQFDHHGNCQTHAIEKPCRVEALRAALLAEPVPGLPAGVTTRDQWALEQVIVALAPREIDGLPCFCNPLVTRTDGSVPQHQPRCQMARLALSETPDDL